MSSFDANSFLEAVVTTGFSDRLPVPADTYNAVIRTVTAESWEKNGKDGVYFKVALDLDIPSGVADEVGLSTPSLSLTDTIFLDIANGTIDTAKGKNKKLKSYRVAVGLNGEGEAFSATALVGKVVKVRLGLEDYKGKMQEKILGVAAA